MGTTIRKVPATALVINTPEGSVEWTFQRCVEYVISTSKRFQTAAGIRRSFRVMSALDDKNEGDDFDWKDEDLAEVAIAFEEAERLLPELTIEVDGKKTPAPVDPRRFIPYLDAVQPLQVG